MEIQMGIELKIEGGDLRVAITYDAGSGSAEYCSSSISLTWLAAALDAARQSTRSPQ